MEPRFLNSDWEATWGPQVWCVRKGVEAMATKDKLDGHYLKSQSHLVFITFYIFTWIWYSQTLTRKRVKKKKKVISTVKLHYWMHGQGPPPTPSCHTVLRTPVVGEWLANISPLLCFSLTEVCNMLYRWKHVSSWGNLTSSNWIIWSSFNLYILSLNDFRYLENGSSIVFWMFTNQPTCHYATSCANEYSFSDDLYCDGWFTVTGSNVKKSLPTVYPLWRFIP